MWIFAGFVELENFVELSYFVESANFVDSLNFVESANFFELESVEYFGYSFESANSAEFDQNSYFVVKPLDKTRFADFVVATAPNRG